MSSEVMDEEGSKSCHGLPSRDKALMKSQVA